MRSSEYIKYYHSTETGEIDLSNPVTDFNSLFPNIGDTPYIFLYNAETGEFLSDSNLRIPLQDNVAGDTIYYGFPQKFFEIYEDITPGSFSDIYIYWAFSTANGFEDIILSDQTDMFSESGSIYIPPIHRWEKSIINGIEAFWIKGYTVFGSNPNLDTTPTSTSTKLAYLLYNKIYVRNENNVVWRNPRSWVEISVEDDVIAIARATSINDVGLEDSYIYKTPRDFSSKDVIIHGDIPPGEYSGLWVRKMIKPGMPINFTFTIHTFGW